MSCPRLRLLALALVLTWGGSSAAAQSVLTLRVDSLDAVLAETGRIGPEPVTRETALAGLSASLGSDVSWLDGGRPMAVTMPVAGMALGVQGMVSVLPVEDADGAIGMLAGGFAEAEQLPGGLWLLSRESEPTTLAVKPAGRYLVAGQTRELVEQIDAAAVLDVPQAPPGPIVLDVAIQTVAPMAQAGLMAARQQMQQMAEAEAGSEEGEAPEIEVEAVMPVIDLYLDIFRDAVANTSRLLLSVETRGDHLLVHTRLVPIPGTTLAGVVASQRTGLPDFVRHLDPTGAPIVFAGRIDLTPAGWAALGEYLRQLGSAMGPLMQAPGMEAPAGDLYTTMLMTSADLMDDCWDGSGAAVMSFGGGSGMSMTQIAGIKNAETCRILSARAAEAVAAVGQGVGLEIRSERHDDVDLIVQDFSLDAFTGVVAQQEEAEEAAEARAVFEAMFGENATLQTYSAILDEVMVTTAGASADREIRALIDALASGGEAPGGISASTFAPLETGPGFYLMYDFASLLRQFSSLIPDVEDAEAMSRELLSGLDEDDGRLLVAVRFPGDALQLDVVIDSGLLKAMAEAGEGEAEPPLSG